MAPPPLREALRVLWYEGYIRVSSRLSDSKTFGLLADGAQKLLGKDGTRASQAFYRKNARRVEAVLSWLADERSKTLYRSLIAYRCRKNRADIDPYMQPKSASYLDRALILPGGREVFVDAGAFGGQSSLAFQELCLRAGQPAPRCVLFEPEAFNYARLQKNLPLFVKEPICFPLGLWREADGRSFTPGALSSSKIDPSGRAKIQVDALDAILQTLPELPPVTYLKIDVEGADLDVLIGARKTIEAHRPRIAVAIYHSDEHMLAIPEYLHALCPSYQFHVRHYCCLESETVLYCV